MKLKLMAVRFADAQDVFMADPKLRDPLKVSAFLCGQKAMAEALTAGLTKLGVPKERILLNF